MPGLVSDNMTSATQPPHVLVIGAGLTGLAIAQGLKQAGIPHTVFEAEDEAKFRPKEWTMGLHWSLPLLEKLIPAEMMARLEKEATVDPNINYGKAPYNGAYIYDGVTGETVKDLTVKDRIVRVTRRRLRKLLSEGIEVQWSHTVKSLSADEGKEEVTATFTNGQSYTGNMLIGTDGPRSAVRSYLFRENPQAGAARPIEGIVNQSLSFRYSDPEVAKYVRTIHPVWSMAIHPDCFPFLSVQQADDPNKPEDWQFYLFVSWNGQRDESLDQEGRMKELKQRGSTLAEPWRSAIVNIPDDTKFSYTDVGYWIAQPWDTMHGTVTLAGDSAHPMPPFRGQGLNHAIQDAYNFVELVKKRAAGEGTQSDLVAEYSDEAAARGAEETQMSLKNGRIMMTYEQFQQSPYAKMGLARGS